MARNIVTFLAMIAREGSAGSVRGKIPAGLVKAINAQEGDGVQFEVHGTTLVGAKVLRGKELRMAVKEKANERKEAAASAPVKKAPAKVVKPTPKATPAPPARKAKSVAKAPVKPSNRKTEVEYEAPRKLKKPTPSGKPVIKLGRKK